MRNIKKNETIHLERMLYNYILGYKSISFKKFKILTFMNKSYTIVDIVEVLMNVRNIQAVN